MEMLPVSIEKLHSYYKECGYTVCTDTRNITPGCVFFCLHGPTFNGNDFAEDALLKGAAWVVADDPKVAAKSNNILFVPNALQMLQDLARYHRHTITTHILAIGGSNGKTTTKELCVAALQKNLKVKATHANLNNHIGVPLTLLQLDGTEDVGIIELGTNHPGEMKVLCDIVEPDTGILTNIGKEHLEGFGSIEEVAREESELYLSLTRNGGLAFVNTDDIWLHSMSNKLPRIFAYGLNQKAALYAEMISELPELKFKLFYQNKYKGEYNAQIGGEYNLYNILAAISVGIYLNIPVEECATNACDYKPANNRSEWRTLGKAHILLDAYNANPSSVEPALKSFATLPGKKVVFLGDMLELGEFSASEHKEILQLAETLPFDAVFTSGPEFKACRPNSALSFDSTTLLVDYLKSNPVQADYFLIKGSRGMKMEMVLEAFI